MESLYLKFFCFFIGASLGSFLNVLIYRLPLKKDIVLTRSHCPRCQREIAWYMNIPILSFMLLKGKCWWCKAKIPMSYPFYEFLMGIVGLLLAPSFLTPINLMYFFIHLSILTIFVAIIAIDLKHHLIPDGLNIYLAAVFLLIALFQMSWKSWLLGGLIGFFIPFLVTLVFYKLKGQVGLGGGDIKLFGALGIILGPIGIIENIFFSCFVGSVVGILLLALKRVDRKTPIPFGPFIVLVAIFQIYLSKYYQLMKSWLLPYA